MDFETRKKEILTSESLIKVPGMGYYVSNKGSDENDGKSEENCRLGIDFHISGVLQSFQSIFQIFLSDTNSQNELICF